MFEYKLESKVILVINYKLAVNFIRNLEKTPIKYLDSSVTV